MCPDISRMFIHLLLHLRQHDGHTLIREETVTAGSLIDVLEIHIPLWSFAMQLHNTADERIRIATGGVCLVVPVFVSVFAIPVLFQQFRNLLLLLCRSRKMAGGIFRHLHTFTGCDVLEVAAGRFLTSWLEVG